MSDEPKLTIGIPTFNRPERLQAAIQSAMGQTIPVKVLVANQTDDDDWELVCKEWLDHPNFKCVQSPATTLWENWRFVAETAADDGAEFFTWLQDDDLLADRFARRVVRSFRHYPGATVYCANLRMAYDNRLGFVGRGNFGPNVPVDIIRGAVMAWPADMLVIAAYFSSWCMSPAKSFRVTDQFRTMLRDLPGNCDCMTERLDIAGAGIGHEFICDPAMAGVWVMHGKNESQISGDRQEGQVEPAYAYLDTLMDQIPHWRKSLAEWMICLGNAYDIESHWKHMRPHRKKSPYAMQISDIFEDSLRTVGSKAVAEADKETEEELADANANGHLIPA